MILLHHEAVVSFVSPVRVTARTDQLTLFDLLEEGLFVSASDQGRYVPDLLPSHMIEVHLPRLETTATVAARFSLELVDLIDQELASSSVAA